MNAPVRWSVAVNGDSNASLILSPQQKAVLDKSSAELTRHDIRNAAHYAAWKEGRLIADNRTVNSILQALNRTYNATVKLENEADLQTALAKLVERVKEGAACSI